MYVRMDLGGPLMLVWCDAYRDGLQGPLQIGQCGVMSGMDFGASLCRSSAMHIRWILGGPPRRQYDVYQIDFEGLTMWGGLLRVYQILNLRHLHVGNCGCISDRYDGHPWA
ncbi:hypothetical protein AVEN_200516-1 [Araneus ventricosus]|uniref:Uncharacterized protein n=1 Tax=Araneus ventricosus TaxID=182803 RepID=A0A4Y2MN31_ARAVE|nr:hypothetical protein AVEN_200516-1 [Araneus ventricosus]